MSSRNYSLWISAALALAGCQGGMNVEGSLPGDTVTRAGTSVSADGHLVLETGGSTLVIERARVLLGELEVEGKRESQEFETGPQVLELGLDGGATSIALSDVPVGTYRELGLELARGASIAADIAGEFGDGDSILVDGTFDGAPFTYASGFAAELEFGLSGVEVKNDQVVTVTVTFDVAGWFLDAAGDAVDPADAANRDLIEANIAASVAAHVEDEDDD